MYRVGDVQRWKAARGKAPPRVLGLSLLYRGRRAVPVEAQARSPTARDGKLARLEAVLFLAAEPLASRKLAQLASLADGTEARTLVRRLNTFYDTEGRTFRVEEVAGGFQLLTRPKFGPWLRRLHQSPVETRLSGPALETLVVVAYRQPVMRAEIEAIRGVQCGEMLRQLMERDLVRISGRSEELGRPFLYGTTKRFLQMFGLRHLDELPQADFLRSGQNPLAVQGEPRNNMQPSPLTNPNDSAEESEVSKAQTADRFQEELLGQATLAVVEGDRLMRPLECALEDDELDADEELEDDDEDDDEDDEDEDDDLEEDEWEEVDDEDDDLDEDDEDDDWEDDDDDWEDDDEEEDDDLPADE
jgi:segregation and condensation protein B